MEYIDGAVHWDPALPQFSNEQRHAMYLQMNEVLSQLHKVNVTAAMARPGIIMSGR
jgi:aminoglycoside phosphotransferase (APT) family kinase protein